MGFFYLQTPHLLHKSIFIKKWSHSQNNCDGIETGKFMKTISNAQTDLKRSNLPTGTRIINCCSLLHLHVLTKQCWTRLPVQQWRKYIESCAWPRLGSKQGQETFLLQVCFNAVGHVYNALLTQILLYVTYTAQTQAWDTNIQMQRGSTDQYFHAG